ncbi:hypothetical protein [Phocaeicola sp.]
MDTGHYSDFTQNVELVELFEQLDQKDHSKMVESSSFISFLKQKGWEQYWEESVDYVSDKFSYLADMDTASYMKQHYNYILFKFIDCISRQGATNDLHSILEILKLL